MRMPIGWRARCEGAIGHEVDVRSVFAGTGHLLSDVGVFADFRARARGQVGELAFLFAADFFDFAHVEV